MFYLPQEGTQYQTKEKKGTNRQEEKSPSKAQTYHQSQTD
jgi:hypothetical protein